MRRIRNGWIIPQANFTWPCATPDDETPQAVGLRYADPTYRAVIFTLVGDGLLNDVLPGRVPAHALANGSVGAKGRDIIR